MSRCEAGNIYKITVEHGTRLTNFWGAAMVPKSIAEDATRWAVSGTLTVASAVTALFLAMVGEIDFPTPPISHW